MKTTERQKRTLFAGDEFRFPSTLHFYYGLLMHQCVSDSDKSMPLRQQAADSFLRNFPYYFQPARVHMFGYYLWSYDL